MVWKNQMLLASSGGVFEENWGAYPSDWDFLDYRPFYSSSLSSGSDVSVSGGRLYPDGFGTNSEGTTYFGPILTKTIDALSGDFALSFDIRFDTSQSQIGVVAVSLIDSTSLSGANPDDAIRTFLIDNGASTTRANYRVTSFVGGTADIFVSIDNDGDASEQNLDIVIERVGDTLTVTTTNQPPYNSSDSVVNETVFDTIVIQFGKFSSNTAPDFSIGPITLEY